MALGLIWQGSRPFHVVAGTPGEAPPHSDPPTHCAKPGQTSEGGWLPWRLQLQPSQEAGTVRAFIFNSRKGQFPGPSLRTGAP